MKPSAPEVNLAGSLSKRLVFLLRPNINFISQENLSNVIEAYTPAPFLGGMFLKDVGADERRKRMERSWHNGARSR